MAAPSTYPEAYRRWVQAEDKLTRLSLQYTGLKVEFIAHKRAQHLERFEYRRLDPWCCWGCGDVYESMPHTWGAGYRGYLCWNCGPCLVVVEECRVKGVRS